MGLVRKEASGQSRDGAKLTPDNPFLASKCPLCEHEWHRHDPEDGRCDAHAHRGTGPCPCGRDLDFMCREIALQSSAALLESGRR